LSTATAVKQVFIARFCNPLIITSTLPSTMSATDTSAALNPAQQSRTSKKEVDESAQGGDRKLAESEAVEEKGATMTAPAVSRARTSSLPSFSPTSMSSSASTPSLRRRLQSIRASDIENEDTLWNHHRQREEEHWQAQEKRYEAMLKRAHSMAGSMKALHGFLKRSASLLTDLSSDLNGLGTAGLSVGTESSETGSLKNAAMSLDSLRGSSATLISELNSRVLNTELKKLAEASDSCSKVAFMIDAAGHGALKQLKLQRGKTSDAWRNYVDASRGRWCVEKSDRVLKSDPFILFRVYEIEEEAEVTTQQKFSALMAELFEELRKEDLKRIQLCKQVLSEIVGAQKNMIQQVTQATNEALNAVSAIDPEQDVNEFLMGSELLLPGGSSVASSLSDSSSSRQSDKESKKSSTQAHTKSSQAKGASSTTSQTPVIGFLQPPPARDPYAMKRIFAHEVAKTGIVYRQGMIMKSKWHRAYAVLTNSGFLHLFEPNGGTHSNSAPLSSATSLSLAATSPSSAASSTSASTDSQSTGSSSSHSTPDRDPTILSSKKSPFISWNLSDALSVRGVPQEAVTEHNQYGIEICFPRQRSFLLRTSSSSPQVVLIKTPDADQQMEWIVSIKKYVRTTDEATKSAGSGSGESSQPSTDTTSPSDAAASASSSSQADKQPTTSTTSQQPPVSDSDDARSSSTPSDKPDTELEATSSEASTDLKEESLAESPMVRGRAMTSAV